MPAIKEASIPNLMLKEGTERSEIDAVAVFSSWMTKLQSAVSAGDSSKLSDLFLEDSWWRDVITLTWDIRSVHGEKIANCIQQAHEAGLTNLVPRESGLLVPQVGEMGPFTLIEGAFSFETKIGRGSGYLRLCNTAPNEWKAWIIMTTLQEIKGHEELLKKSAPPYWSNAVDDAKYEAESQKSPHVLIVGAGHSALSLCARLKQLGISALMVDKTERVGDSWRQRYMNLCLHDPRWENHQPYLRFPDTFPAWIPRKQLADWLEHYQSVMQLPIRMNSTVSKAQWNADSKTWTVNITAKDGSKTTLNPHHVVLATGLHSDEGRIPDFPGLDSFKGPIIHSTKYTTASDVPDYKSKKFVVIGSSSSSHDICQDLAEAGCDVTMVQRDVNAVYSLNAKNNVVGAPYMKPGISTEEADILTASMPFPVVMTMMIGGQAMMYQMDKELMDRVGKTEFKFLKGDDGRSLLHLIFTKGGVCYMIPLTLAECQLTTV